jgi:hypothetical protein
MRSICASSAAARSPIIGVRQVAQQAIDGVFDRRGLAQAAGFGQTFQLADYRRVGDLRGCGRLPECGYPQDQYRKLSSKQQVLLREDIGLRRAFSGARALHGKPNCRARAITPRC